MNFKNKIVVLFEWLFFGGRLLETICLWTLDRYYRSLFRRHWKYAEHQPHSTNHRLTAFLTFFSENHPEALCYARAFYSAELIKNSDDVLDIGTGDGFIANRFFAPRAKSVDAIDIERESISEAHALYSKENLKFHQLDAVRDSFPKNKYQLIIWDGAIGHFEKSTIDLVLKKIASHLSHDGVFCGSESLGKEGLDHLIEFHSTDELRKLFEPHFKYVFTKQLNLRAGINGEFPREEAYWRCTNSQDRSLSWS